MTAARVAPFAAALLLAGCNLLDTTSSDTEIRLPPTHRAVVYGTVRTPGGAPVVGATVTPTISQVCPCYVANIYLAEGTQQTTTAAGEYRIAYEAAVPPSSRTQGRLVFRLEVQPPTGSNLPLTYANVPYPLSLALPLDSARVDVVVR